MLTYVVYSHSEYSDILTAHTHYLSSYENKVLLIDKAGAELTELCSNYKQVLFYDDTLPYASRLLKLNELNLDYILFIHDVDVLVKRDDSVVEFLLNKMIKHDIDRIDLQYQNNIYNSITETILIEHNDSKFYLNKQEDINHYIYNVQPSIWRVSTFMEIMLRFQNETYRTIELEPTQLFCQKYRIFKLYWESYINCGHFGCIPFFQFIHLTHGGKLLSWTDNPDDCGPYQNIHYTLQGTYQSIIDDFNLTATRKFDTRYYGSDYYHGPSKDSR